METAQWPPLGSPTGSLLDLNCVRLVPVAVKACEANIVLLGTTTLCDWCDVIELDFRIVEMFPAMLAGVVVAADDPYLYGEWNVASPASGLTRFGHSLT